MHVASERDRSGDIQLAVERRGCPGSADAAEFDRKVTAGGEREISRSQQAWGGARAWQNRAAALDRRCAHRARSADFSARVHGDGASSKRSADEQSAGADRSDAAERSVIARDCKRARAGLSETPDASDGPGECLRGRGRVFESRPRGQRNGAGISAGTQVTRAADRERACADDGIARVRVRAGERARVGIACHRQRGGTSARDDAREGDGAVAAGEIKRAARGQRDIGADGGAVRSRVSTAKRAAVEHDRHGQRQGAKPARRQQGGARVDRDCPRARDRGRLLGQAARRVIVHDLQRAGVDDDVSRAGHVHAVEGQRARAVLCERESAQIDRSVLSGDRAKEDGLLSACIGDGGIAGEREIGDVTLGRRARIAERAGARQGEVRDRERVEIKGGAQGNDHPRRAAERGGIAEAQCAGIDRGGASVGVRRIEDERARAVLRYCRPAGNGARAAERIGPRGIHDDRRGHQRAIERHGLDRGAVVEGHRVSLVEIVRGRGRRGAHEIAVSIQDAPVCIRGAAPCEADPGGIEVQDARSRCVDCAAINACEIRRPRERTGVVNERILRSAHRAGEKNERSGAGKGDAAVEHEGPSGIIQRRASLKHERCIVSGRAPQGSRAAKSAPGRNGRAGIADAAGEKERAGADGDRSRKRTGARKRGRARAGLRHRAAAGNRIPHVRGAALAECECGAGVHCDRARGERAGGRGRAELQRARADRRAAGVGFSRGEDESPRAGLHQRAARARPNARCQRDRIAIGVECGRLGVHQGKPGGDVVRVRAIPLERAAIH